jgi:hypothetical protein
MKVKSMQLSEVKVGARVVGSIGRKMFKGDVIIQLGNGDTVLRNLDNTTFIVNGNTEVSQYVGRRK